MKKSSWIMILIVIIIIVLFLAFYNFNIKRNSSNNSTSNKQNSIFNDIKNTNLDLNDVSGINNMNNNNFSENSSYAIENEVASFSTNLSGDSNRLENIRLTCSTINEYVLENGRTFSFNEIVGKPTADKGYKEADVIIGTKTEKALGGGNCQVSTTLYNAALAINNIEIVERNPHKKKVGYIEEGKDASVSYGNLDLKFKNNTGNTLKIYMNSENKKVTARIVKISY